MDIDSIGFDDGWPATVILAVSVEEAAAITKLLDRLTGGIELLTDMSDTLNDMFNRYWDDGVGEVPTPLDGVLPERIELNVKRP